MSIVVGYPNADEGRPLFEAGVLHAQRAGSDLVLLHHAKLRNKDAPQAVDDEVQHVQRVRRELQALAAEAREQGLTCRVIVDTDPHEDPSRQVLDRLEQESAEMLVVGVRSRSRVGKLLLGSTTQDLILAAKCPVLAVKVP